MKTRSIARGIVGAVASLLGVVAVGCSADVSDPQSGEAEIGSTSQALITPTVTAVTAMPSGTGRINAAACAMIDPVTSKEYLAVAGGEDLSGNVLDTILVYDIAGATWTNLSTLGTPIKLEVARTRLQAIQVPSDSSKCDFLGGQGATGAAIAAGDNFDILAVNNGTFSITKNTGGLVARADFAVSTCGTNVLVFAGQNNGTLLATGSSNMIQKSTGTAAFSNVGDLAAGQAEFAFSKEADNEYVLSAGISPGASPSNVAQAVKLSSCSSVSSARASDGNPGKPFLTNTLRGAALYSIGSSVHRLIGGYDSTGPALPLTADDITVNWAASPVTWTLTARANNQLVTGARYPMIGIDSNGKLGLFGGDNGTGTTHTANGVQSLPSPYSTAASAWGGGNAATLNAGRYLGAVVHTSSDQFFLVTGRDTTGLVLAVDQVH